MIIGIVHHPSTRPFLIDLLHSLKGVKYPVVIVNNGREYEHNFNHRVIQNDHDGYELGALKLLKDRDDSVFLLQDTTEIKDQSIFDIANEYEGSIALCARFMSFLGKYRTEVINQIGIPIVDGKEHSITLETEWTNQYIRNEPNFQFIQPLQDNPNREFKHGRLNMILENDYIKKYKGTWR